MAAQEATTEHTTQQTLRSIASSHQAAAPTGGPSLSASASVGDSPKVTAEQALKFVIDNRRDIADLLSRVACIEELLVKRDTASVKANHPLATEKKINIPDDVLQTIQANAFLEENYIQVGHEVNLRMLTYPTSYPTTKFDWDKAKHDLYLGGVHDGLVWRAELMVYLIERGIYFQFPCSSVMDRTPPTPDFKAVVVAMNANQFDLVSLSEVIVSFANCNANTFVICEALDSHYVGNETIKSVIDPTFVYSRRQEVQQCYDLVKQLMQRCQTLFPYRPNQFTTVEKFRDSIVYQHKNKVFGSYTRIDKSDIIQVVADFILQHDDPMTDCAFLLVYGMMHRIVGDGHSVNIAALCETYKLPVRTVMREIKLCRCLVAESAISDDMTASHRMLFLPV
jgi:hypothetical protein